MSRSASRALWPADQLPSRIATSPALIARVKDFEAKFEGRDVPRPENWGGYRLRPLRIEFWKAGEFRLHDREVYERLGEQWTVQRLYP